MSTTAEHAEHSPAAQRFLRGPAVLPQGLVPDALIAISGAGITHAGPASSAPDIDPTLVEDVAGGMILPGLVDLHCHGGGGVSFPDAEDAATMTAAVREHRRHGTTSLVASLVTASPDTLRARVAELAALARAGEVEGIHLEGPFLSVDRCGAQNPAEIRAGDAAEVRALAELAGGALATMTVAPEVPGADAVIEALAETGAVPSLGHSDADSASFTAGIARSREALRRHRGRSPLPTATHLFNGMRPVHHRDPGPALAALDAAARGEMVVEVIGDGVHLDPRTVAHVFALAAEDQVALVTDAMAAAGVADGAYRLGSLAVEVSGGVARLAEGGAIAGGTAHLIDVVRASVLEAGVDLARAVRAASLVPARVLGAEDRLGSLAPGRRADVLITDRDLRPRRVLRAGQDVEV